jgi:branched-chain amino acid transport system ATP-binding protein
MSVALVELDQVRKAFGGLVAVRDVSFRIDPGEVIGLIGPNGSGKTTLINLMSGTLSADQGEMRLSGEEMLRKPAHRRARSGIGRTFQLVRVIGEMTALENVTTGLLLRPGLAWGEETRHEAAALLARVGLLERIIRRPPTSLMATRSVSSWPARWRYARAFCCSTNGLPASTPPSCRTVSL